MIKRYLTRIVTVTSNTFFSHPRAKPFGYMCSIWHLTSTFLFCVRKIVFWNTNVYSSFFSGDCENLTLLHIVWNLYNKNERRISALWPLLLWAMFVPTQGNERWRWDSKVPNMQSRLWHHSHIVLVEWKWQPYTRETNRYKVLFFDYVSFVWVMCKVLFMCFLTYTSILYLDHCSFYDFRRCFLLHNLCITC